MIGASKIFLNVTKSQKGVAFQKLSIPNGLTLACQWWAVPLNELADKAANV